MEYFVYSGYVNCDNYDSPMSHTIKAVCSSVAVCQLYEEFYEEVNERDDNSEVVFRVFYGTEQKLVPIEKITSYELENK